MYFFHVSYDGLLAFLTQKIGYLAFKSAFPIEAYFETTEGFAGQQELINKFGLEIREDTTFMISKRRFDLKFYNKKKLKDR